MNVYSFADMPTILSHPALGSFSAQGEGFGSITFARAGDISAHVAVADGTVMTNKLEAKHGTITITTLQTSELCSWLVRLINFLEMSDSKYFNQLTISSSSTNMRRQHNGTGCSPQKLPDTAYAAQGAERSFVFLAEVLTEGVI